jgi:hypothetical protein
MFLPITKARSGSIDELQNRPFDETARRRPTTHSGILFHASDNLVLCIKTRLKNSVSKGSAVYGKRETKRMAENNSNSTF